MRKPIYERITAIVTVLERLATDVEIIRDGLERAALLMPKELYDHQLLLVTQSSALERVSISLGMAQHTVTNLEEIHDHARIIMNETQTLLFLKEGLASVPDAKDRPGCWHPMMLEKEIHRFDQCIERIRKAAGCQSARNFDPPCASKSDPPRSCC